MREKIAGLEIPLFVLFPIAGFLSALCNMKSKANAFIYIAFAMLFGYAISFTNDSADSFRYAQAFSRFDNRLDYNALVQMYQNGELRDLYRVILFYFTSMFTNNPKVMYAFAGFIYGIFSYLNLRIFVKERGIVWDKYVFILSVVFFTYISLANINGFRFWTGAMVLFYATYNFIIHKRTAWAVGILITPLFHYGFILLMPILIIYRFVHPLLYDSKNFASILLYIFIGAFFASWILDTNAINLGFLTQNDALAGAVGNRIDYVNSEQVADVVESRKSDSLFLSVRTYFNYAIKIYIFIGVLFLNKLLKRMNGDRTLYTNLFAFVLFFYSVALIATSFPSGGRFMNIAHLFFIVLLGKFYEVYKRRNIQILILGALLVFSFEIAIVNCMLPIMVLTPTFWYGNIFWIILEGWGFYV